MLCKVDDKIQILQLARCKNKRQKETEIWMEKDGFKSNKLKSRLKTSKRREENCTGKYLRGLRHQNGE